MVVPHLLREQGGMKTTTVILLVLHQEEEKGKVRLVLEEGPVLQLVVPRVIKITPTAARKPNTRAHNSTMSRISAAHDMSAAVSWILELLYMIPLQFKALSIIPNMRKNIFILEIIAGRYPVLYGSPVSLMNLARKSLSLLLTQRSNLSRNMSRGNFLTRISPRMMQRYQHTPRTLYGTIFRSPRPSSK